MYVLIFGSFSIGFNIVGPFTNGVTALKYAEENLELPVTYFVEKVVDPTTWKIAHASVIGREEQR